MAQYYLSKNGVQSGPFSQEQIDQMLRSGMFSGVEVYRQDDAPDWKSITQLPGFVPPIPTVPPPVAAVPVAVQPAGKSSCLVIGLIIGAVTFVLVAVIALLAAIAMPGFLRAKKRSQATRVLEDLRIIDAAIDQYAIENDKTSGARVDWADIQSYLRPGSRLHSSGGKDVLGNQIGPDFKVDTVPKVPEQTYEKLKDVAPADFWEPYK